MRVKLAGPEWDYLGVSEAQVRAVPRISQALKKVLGGKEEILELLRKSEAREAQRVLELVDAAPESYVEKLPLEAFCVAAKVNPKRLFGIIAECVFEESQNEALLIAAKETPAVVEATVESAKGGSSAAQKMILQHAKIAPVPKTAITTIIGNPVIEQGSRTQTVVMPIAEDGVKKMSERFNRNVTDTARGLLPPAENVQIISAEDAEDEEPEEPEE